MPATTNAELAIDSSSRDFQADDGGVLQTSRHFQLTTPKNGG